MSVDTVQALLGRPELRALFHRVRAALEERGPEQARSVTLTGLTAVEREAIAGLHGWSEVPEGDKVRISLAKLDVALRESVVGRGLIETVEALSGPLAPRRELRDEALAAREALWSRAREHRRVRERLALQRWLDELRTRGLLVRAAKVTGKTEAVLLEQVLAAAVRLPSSGTLLAVFASELFGDAHALDPGRAEAGLLLRAAAAIAGWEGPPASAAERRRLWAEVGIACDPLSTDVLTLGLRPTGDELLPRHLRESSEEGEPRRVTLRELMRRSVAVTPGTAVFVCENPSVVAAAAERLGAGCAALLCTEGVPSTAALQLLGALESSGARIHLHADFDWAGVRITNLLRAHLPAAAPWRMGANEYEQAARNGELLELTGLPITAGWAPDLAPAMSRYKVAVPEESVIDQLLVDLHWP